MEQEHDMHAEVREWLAKQAATLREQGYVTSDCPWRSGIREFGWRLEGPLLSMGNPYQRFDQASTMTLYAELSDGTEITVPAGQLAAPVH